VAFAAKIVAEENKGAGLLWGKAHGGDLAGIDVGTDIQIRAVKTVQPVERCQLENDGYTFFTLISLGLYSYFLAVNLITWPDSSAKAAVTLGCNWNGNLTRQFIYDHFYLLEMMPAENLLVFSP
jgi:hypothetical protein